DPRRRSREVPGVGDLPPKIEGAHEGEGFADRHPLLRAETPGGRETGVRRGELAGPDPLEGRGREEEDGGRAVPGFDDFHTVPENGNRRLRHSLPLTSARGEVVSRPGLGPSAATTRRRRGAREPRRGAPRAIPWAVRPGCSP